MSRKTQVSQTAQRKANDQVYAEGLQWVKTLGPRMAFSVAEASYRVMLADNDPRKDLAKQWAMQSLKCNLYQILQSEKNYEKGYVELRLKHIMELNKLCKKVSTYSI